MSASDIFDQARSAVSRLLIESIAPGGEWKADGEYWPISPLGNHSKIGAFHISESGVWFDFGASSNSEESGDFIKLVQLVHNCTPKAAAEWILTQTGRTIDKPKPAKKAKPKAVYPIPESAKLALNAEIVSDYAKREHGKPAGGWRYHGADGGWAFAVVRFDKPDGGKDVIPYYFDGARWREGQAFADGRPLYNLPALLASPELPVLVVEGEKCASVPVPGYVVTTWSAGASSVAKTDWKPLEGRSVLVWPDADEPGAKAAAKIAALCPGAAVLAIEGRPHGWDIADAVAEGIDPAAFIAECPRIGAAPEPAEEAPAEAEPFRVLGYDGEQYWFLLGSQRQPFSIGKGGFTGSKLGELAPPTWWGEHGAIGDKGSIDVTRAQQIVIDRQNKRGIFDPAILRGAGVWLEESGVVINDGARIVEADGKTTPLSEYHGSAEYVRSRVHFGDMTGDEATAEEGRKLYQLVKAQQWSRKNDAVAVLGWSLIAPFGGLLEFRPHLWISGRKGTGKTFALENIIREVCGPFAHQGSGKDTEAGIRRTLNMDARPVILDEMEPKGKARENIVKILDLARNASSDGSGRVTMADGKGTVSFLIRSCFCFASVNTSAGEGAAIASRIISAELVAPKSKGDEMAKIALSKKLYGEAMADPARYRRRMFRALPRIIDDIASIREVLPSFLGGSREADLWAPIYAAAWAAQSDERVTEAAGLKWLESVVSEETATREEVPEDEDRVIEHILGASIESDDRKRRTIAEWLCMAQETDAGFKYAEELLSRFGLRVMSVKEKKVLAVATKSDALGKLLKDTPYEVGYDSQVRRNKVCLNPEKSDRQWMAGRLISVRLLDWAGFKTVYMGEAQA